MCTLVLVKYWAAAGSKDFTPGSYHITQEVINQVTPHFQSSNESIYLNRFDLDFKIS